MQTARRILLIGAMAAALALISPRAAAEPRAGLRDFAVRTWTSADGLPDAPVTVIVQTRDGNLWIGTGAGLFRFDGLKFTKIPLPAGRNHGLVFITALCEDNAGNLWAGSQGQGLFRWRNNAGAHFDSAEGLIDSDVTSLSLDNGGQLWIGTRKGVDRYDGRRFTALTTQDGLQSNQVTSVHAAHSGTVWISTTGGICRFITNHLEPYHFPAGAQESDQGLAQVYEDRRGNLWVFRGTYLINLAEGKRINYFPGEKSAKTRVWSLCEGRGGRLWIGASGRGVFLLDGAAFQPVTLNEGRWPNDVRTICEDHEGNLWLGISDIGLVQLRPQAFALLTENQGLPPGPTTCLATDGAGRLFVGMDAGGIYENGADHFSPVRQQDPFLGQDFISSLCTTPDGSVWAATAGTGLCQIKDGRTVAYTTSDGLADDAVTVLSAAGDDAVWAGMRGGAVQLLAGGRFTTYTKADGLPGTPVTAMLAARHGLWVGTGDGVLIHAGENFNDASMVTLPPGLAGKAILGLCQSANGGLWIGTDGGGAGYINGNIRRSWNSQSGLPDDVVSGAAEDDQTNLWLVTTKGLCLVGCNAVAQALASPAPLKAKMVYETDAATLKETGPSGPRALRVSSGRVWVILNGTLVGVDVQGRETDEPPPQVHIESVLVNDAAIPLLPEESTVSNMPPARLLRIPTSQRKLEFRFTGLSFENPEKVRFRHKLIGFDAGWVDGGGERKASYGPLPEGEYDFHVTACNAEGVWNETGASLAFVIHPPWWRAPWALAVATLTATILGAGGVRMVSHRRLRVRVRGLEQQRAMERERIRIAQNMHDEIGSKLTKISYLSERAKVELRGTGKAEAKIDSIAATSHDLLKTLDEIVWAVNPKNDSLEHLAAYLCQYAREYFQDTAVECDLHVQSTLPDVQMSAETRHNLFLAFEESLNNVLKHARASRLNVNITTQNGGLRITIGDNGQGFAGRARASAKATGGNGLRNLRERLDSIGGECKIESAPGHGTTVCLSLPLKSANLHTR